MSDKLTAFLFFIFSLDGIIETAADIEPLAGSVADSGGVYLVPAFSGLFARFWRSDARGVIVGLTRQSTKAHIARAALEAICFQTRDVLDAMKEDTGQNGRFKARRFPLILKEDPTA